MALPQARLRLHTMSTRRLPTSMPQCNRSWRVERTSNTSSISASSPSSLACVGLARRQTAGQSTRLPSSNSASLPTLAPSPAKSSPSRLARPPSRQKHFLSYVEASQSSRSTGKAGRTRRGTSRTRTTSCAPCSQTRTRTKSYTCSRTARRDTQRAVAFHACITSRTSMARTRASLCFRTSAFASRVNIDSSCACLRRLGRRCTTAGASTLIHSWYTRRSGFQAWRSPRAYRARLPTRGSKFAFARILEDAAARGSAQVLVEGQVAAVRRTNYRLGRHHREQWWPTHSPSASAATVG